MGTDSGVLPGHCTGGRRPAAIRGEQRWDQMDIPFVAEGHAHGLPAQAAHGLGAGEPTSDLPHVVAPVAFRRAFSIGGHRADQRDRGPIPSDGVADGRGHGSMVERHAQPERVGHRPRRQRHRGEHRAGRQRHAGELDRSPAAPSLVRRVDGHGSHARSLFPGPAWRFVATHQGPQLLGVRRPGPRSGRTCRGAGRAAPGCRRTPPARAGRPHRPPAGSPGRRSGRRSRPAATGSASR